MHVDFVVVIPDVRPLPSLLLLEHPPSINVSPFFTCSYASLPHNYRPHQDLQEEFARELPRDLETLTFAFGFDRAIIDVDWPPRIKTINFGDSFNPRGEPTAARGRPLSPTNDGMGNRGSGGNKDWAKFLPIGLEEVSFGTCFNQPVVRCCTEIGRRVISGQERRVISGQEIYFKVASGRVFPRCVHARVSDFAVCQESGFVEKGHVGPHRWTGWP